jgi:hypothetical protein
MERRSKCKIENLKIHRNRNIYNKFVFFQFTLKKYFDVSAATAQVQPTTVSKVNTAFQLTLVASALASPVFQFVGHPAFTALWYLKF